MSLRRIISFAACAGALLSTAPSSALAGGLPAYYPEGPQRNVPEQTIIDGGWVACYGDGFNRGGSFRIDYLIRDCNSDHLLMGGRPSVSPNNWDLVAAGPREAVFGDVGTDLHATTQANGSAWYFNAASSWGFAKAGDQVNRDACDYPAAPEYETNSELRMCWHTGNNSVQPGYRMGDIYYPDLNDRLRYLMVYRGLTTTAAQSSYDLGTQRLNAISDTTDVRLTLTHQAGTFDRVGKLRITGPDAKDFTLHTEYSDDTCPRAGDTVALGQTASCTVAVTFHPSAQGARNAVLGFDGVVGDIKLTGVGGDPLKGIVGDKGPTGSDGAPGTPGSPGSDGAPGAPGAQGPAGADGAPGAPGAQGPQGSAGANGSSGTDGTPGAQGPQGSAGANGSNGAPGMPGAQGPQGPSGANGSNGASGPRGTSGRNGTDGKNGSNGADGKNGTNGRDGANGSDGKNGLPHPDYRALKNPVRCVAGRAKGLMVYRCTFSNRLGRNTPIKLRDQNGRVIGYGQAKGTSRTETIRVTRRSWGKPEVLVALNVTRGASPAQR